MNDSIDQAALPDPKTVEAAGETYDVSKVPGKESAIVIEKISDILVGIKLDKMVANLNITSELIHLAYNATPPRYGDIRADIDSLHIKFIDSCAECTSELSALRDVAKVVSGKLAGAFANLYKGAEPATIMILSTCKTDAEKLAERMQGLADKFQELCDIADRAKDSAIRERGKEIENLHEIEKALAEQEARKAQLEELTEKLKELIKTIESEYREAKDQLATTEERAFALALTGAIMQPLGQAFGTIGSALAGYYASQDPSRIARGAAEGLSGKGSSGGEEAPETKVPAEQRKKFVEAESALEKAELDLKVAEADVEIVVALIDAAEEVKKEIDDSDADKKEKKASKAVIDEIAKEAKKKRDDAVIAKEEAEQEKKERQAAYNAARESIEALGVAVSDIGSNMKEMGNDYLELASQQREHVRELFQLMIQKQDIEREALSDLAYVTERLARLDIERQTSEITISALFQTIGAMKQVVDILHEAATFWNNMKKACEQLADGSLLSQIQAYAAMTDSGDRVEMFYGQDYFKTELIDHLGRWVALQSIAETYLKETTNIREMSREDFRKNLDAEQAALLVSDLSVKLLDELNDQTEDSNAETDVIKRALDNMNRIGQAADASV